MLLRVLRFLAGVALLPFCVPATLTVASLVRGLQPDGAQTVPPAAWALGGGFALWTFLYVVLPRPVRSYVLAHELTHALWGALMGAHIFRMHVGEDRGSVTLSKSNFLITLAPYFFPLYTVLVIAGYAALSLFVDASSYHLYWLALVGFTWGFHLTFTVSMLFQHQSDIRECGYVFSYVTVYLMNVLGICLWIVGVSSATLAQMALYFRGHLGLLVDWARLAVERLQ